MMIGSIFYDDDDVSCQLRDAMNSHDDCRKDEKFSVFEQVQSCNFNFNSCLVGARGSEHLSLIAMQGMHPNDAN